MSKDNCSFIHINIRSDISQFENNLPNIHQKFTFIGLSETWINEGTADLFSINVCEHKLRSCRREGGIAIFIRDHVSCTLRNDLIVFQTDIESIFIEVEGKYMNSYIKITHKVACFSNSKH